MHAANLLLLPALSVLGSLWTWAIVNLIIRCGSGVEKVDRLNHEQVGADFFPPEHQVLTSVIDQLMATSLFASPFVEGNKLIYLNSRVEQLGKAISCWILFSGFSPN